MLWLVLACYGPGELCMYEMVEWVGANVWCRGVDIVYAYDGAEGESYACSGWEEKFMRHCNFAICGKHSDSIKIQVVITSYDISGAQLT